jgi:hypothetical protein
MDRSTAPVKERECCSQAKAEAACDPHSMAWRESELLASVKRLAAPADEQTAYLKQFGSFPSLDELALEFGDMFGPPGTPPPTGPEGWTEGLRRLDAMLSQMSGRDNAHLWSADALDGPEWAAVREVARAALASRPR